MCKCDKCSIPSMKPLNTSNGGTDIFSEWCLTVNWLKYRHLLSNGRTSSIEGLPLFQRRWTSVIFGTSAGSNSVKSLRTRQYTFIRSVSTWRQLLTICEEVRSVVLIRKEINPTSFKSLALLAQTFSFFSFLRPAISLRKLFETPDNLRVWMFKQTERIHLASAGIERSCDF